MFRRPIKEINAEFSAEETHLDDIRRIVRESCVAAGLPRKETSSVLLAIEEGATNIIRHAYLYKTGMIRVRVVIFSKQMVISLIDSGRSFTPPGSEGIDFEKMVESGRKGGLGFYMIRKIMDSVEYITAAGFNELRMIKRITPTRTGGRPFLRRLMSLRVSFSLWTFMVVLVIVGLSYWYANFRASNQLHQHLDDTVLSLGETIAEQAAGLLINRRSHVEFDQLIVSNLKANPELELVVLTDSAGFIIAHSRDVRRLRKKYEYPESVDQHALNMPQPFRQSGSELRYLMLSIPSGERTLGSVHVAYSAENLKSRLAEARTQIAYVTLILLLFGVLAIYLLSNYFVRPIAQITSRVRRFTSGDLETELPLEGAEEFFEISRAFNQMMTRLSRDRKNIIEREKLAKEMEVASEIQKTLLPSKLPKLPGMEIDAVYRPASVVSGDLYDVFKVGESRYCLTVADVSGKGVPASLVMSMLRTLIRIYAIGEDS
ncbi:MAG: ATP-binding protein, partial [bacterium]|nr:ATP-binding protein [bacterium]